MGLFKVYTAAREYVGALKHAEDAAAVAMLHGAGATVRDGHRTIVYTVAEGADSYDEAAAEILEAIAQTHGAVRLELGAPRPADPADGRRRPPPEVSA